MTDRAAKRLRRVSTEYDDSEDTMEWNNSRYVADPQHRARRRAFLRARGRTARHQAAAVGASKQQTPADGQQADGRRQTADSKQSAAGARPLQQAQANAPRPPPLCATRAVNPCAHPVEGARI